MTVMDLTAWMTDALTSSGFGAGVGVVVGYFWGRADRVPSRRRR